MANTIDISAGLVPKASAPASPTAGASPNIDISAGLVPKTAVQQNGPAGPWAAAPLSPAATSNSGATGANGAVTPPASTPAGITPAAAPPAPAPADQRGAIARFFSNAAQNVLPSTTPSDYMQGPVYALRHPVDSAKLYAGAIADSVRQMSGLENQGAQEAGAVMPALKRGDFAAAVTNYMNGLRHSVAGAIPFVGPALNAGAEQAGSGDVAGGLGTATGVVAQFAAPGLVRGALAKAVESPVPFRGALADTMAEKPPGSTLTRAELDQFATDHDIHLSTGQASGSPLFRAMDAIGGRSLLPDVDRMATANGNAVMRATSDLQFDVDPRQMGSDLDAVGHDLRVQAQHIYGNEQRAASAAQMNSAIGEKVNKIGGVDANALRGFAANELFEPGAPGGGVTWTPKESLKALSEMWRPGRMPDAVARAFTGENLIPMLPAGGEAADAAAVDTRIKDVLGQISLPPADPRSPVILRKLGLPYDPDTLSRIANQLAGTEPTAQGQEALGPMSWRSGVRLRSHFYDQGNDFTGRIPTQTAGLYKKGTEILDDAMEKAAQQAGPDVLTQWRDANAKTKALHEDWNEQKSPLYYTGAREGNMSEAQLAGRFVNQGQYGGDPASIRALKDKGFDLGPLQSAVINRIKEQNFSARKGRLGGYSDTYLNELFPAPVLSDLKNIGAVARASRFELNPSGTSNVLIQHSQMQDVLKRAISGNRIQTGGLGAAGAFLATGHPVAAALAAGPAVAGPAIAAKLATSEALKSFFTTPSLRGAFAEAVRGRPGLGRIAPYVLARSAGQGKRGE